MDCARVCKKLNIIIIITFILSLFVNLYFSDKALTAGNELSMYEARANELVVENEYLQNKYFTVSSMSSISKLAEEYGFTESQSEYYTSSDLAFRQ